MIEAPIDLPCGVILKNRIVKSGLSEALGDLNNCLLYTSDAADE